MSSLLPRDLLMKSFPNQPRLWYAFEAQADAIDSQAQRLPSLETKVALIDGNVSAATTAAAGAQPTSVVLTSIANVAPSPGVIEQLDPGNFTVRPIDQQDVLSLISRGVGDTRYLGAFQPAPLTSTSAGTAGRVAVDVNYLYVCVAPSSWKRIALTAF